MSLFPAIPPNSSPLMELGLHLIEQEQQAQIAHNIALVADIDNFLVLTADREPGYMQAVREQVQAVLRGLVQVEAPGALLVPFDLDAYVILLSLPRAAGAQPSHVRAEALAVKLADALVQAARRETTFTIAVGVSQYHPEPGGALAAVQEAIAAVRHKLILGGNRVLYVRDIGPAQPPDTALAALGPEHPLWTMVRRGDSADLPGVLNRWLQQLVVNSHPTPAALDNLIADTLLYSLRVVSESGTSPLYNHAVNRLLQELKILGTIHEQSYLAFRLENYFRELVTLVAASSTAAHDAVTRARQIIHERFANDLSLASVAQEVYVSPYHLSHLFRRMLGMTFLEYLTEYRLQQARVYLEETRDTVAVIAMRVGYSDARHFSQLFKKRLGITPTQHRQRMLSRL